MIGTALSTSLDGFIAGAGDNPAPIYGRRSLYRPKRCARESLVKPSHPLLDLAN
jgi:hypothetical protein